jgi:hypothetical protein
MRRSESRFDARGAETSVGGHAPSPEEPVRAPVAVRVWAFGNGVADEAGDDDGSDGAGGRAWELNGGVVDKADDDDRADGAGHRA